MGHKYGAGSGRKEKAKGSQLFFGFFFFGSVTHLECLLDGNHLVKGGGCFVRHPSLHLKRCFPLPLLTESRPSKKFGNPNSSSARTRRSIDSDPLPPRSARAGLRVLQLPSRWLPMACAPSLPPLPVAFFLSFELGKAAFFLGFRCSVQDVICT